MTLLNRTTVRNVVMHVSNAKSAQVCKPSTAKIEIIHHAGNECVPSPPNTFGTSQECSYANIWRPLSSWSGAAVFQHLIEFRSRSKWMKWGHSHACFDLHEAKRNFLDHDDQVDRVGVGRTPGVHSIHLGNFFVHLGNFVSFTSLPTRGSARFYICERQPSQQCCSYSCNGSSDLAVIQVYLYNKSVVKKMVWN